MEKEASTIGEDGKFLLSDQVDLFHLRNSKLLTLLINLWSRFYKGLAIEIQFDTQKN